jgi:isopentenyl phosphate kinase
MNATITIKILKLTGDFAENKDTAREIRVGVIEPALKKDQSIVIDFHGVDAATQSFIHALISQVIRDHTIDVLSRIAFKDANETVRQIIEIVVDYMQHEDE